MNTAPKMASAKVLSNVLKKTIYKGEKFCRIFQPKKNWNETLIKPAIIQIKKRYFRPLEVSNLKGNYKKARNKLKWSPKINITKLIDEMINYEIKNA